MKGQIRIISEILLFMVGIVITSFVIFTFTNIASISEERALNDQLTGVADTISSAILKVTSNKNTSLTIEIPAKLSGKQYAIILDESLIITDGRIEIVRELFNITKSYNIITSDGGRITSSAQYLTIRSDDKNNIIISRY
ncbi:MAG: hypothetical protein HY513_02185 [Candidatus Aenigmarchaeota archaeon]|nr:hypothetical protein [Candidatus Aenigmarchaeota archaeon]